MIQIKQRITGEVLEEVDAGNLRGADLRGADLRGADLSGADLRDADLRNADLRDADLSGADLRDADLSRADLSRADLRDADLSGADLSRAYLRGADLRGAKGLPPIPKVENLDSKILKQIAAGGKLEMDVWHTCETTHCRGGWAILLAGKPGTKLEEAVGSDAAASMIYNASTGRVPDFYATDEDALADIREQAAKNA